MTSLDEIKPVSLSRVIDVVDASGISVETWRASGNASNPKYCYEWAFAQSDYSVVMLCLWYDECEVDDFGIFQAGSIWPLINRLEERKTPTAPRARRFDDTLQQAWFHKSVIRIAIVDQKERRKAAFVDGDTMHADFRELDPVSWRLVAYDHANGSYELRRGLEGSADSTLVSEAPESYAHTLSSDDGASDPEVPNLSERAVGLAKDLLSIVQRTDIDTTTRETMVLARVGQGLFRRRLIERWEGRCAVTGCSNLTVLRASHIRPWRDCGDEERLSADNGLLLTANLDALFDASLISFQEDGRIWVSPGLSLAERQELNLEQGLRRVPSSTERYFLDDHLQNAIAKSLAK